MNSQPDKRQLTLEQELLNICGAALQEIAQVIPRHDMVIQRLEPRLGSMVTDLKESQNQHHRSLQVELERTFDDMRQTLRGLVRDRESVYTVLAHTHADVITLSQAAQAGAPPEEIAARAAMVTEWLRRAFDQAGLEPVTGLEGLAYDSASMQIVRAESRSDCAVGTVLKELAPGYRMRTDDSVRCLVRAQVVINVGSL